MTELETRYNRSPSYEIHFWDKRDYLALLRNKVTDTVVILSPLALMLYTFADGPFNYGESYAFLESCRGFDRQKLGDDPRRVFDDLVRLGILVPTEDHDRSDVPQAKNESYSLTHVYLYSTQRCNLHCYHCYQDTVFSPIGSHGLTKHLEFSLGSLASFIDDARPLGLQLVKLTGGEPLIRRDIKEMISMLAARGVEITMETNGTLVTPELADFLVDKRVGLSVSLDGSTSELHDALRGVKGAFEKTTAVIKFLAARSPNLKVITAVSHRNLSDVQNICDLVSSLGVREIKINPVNELGVAGTSSNSQYLLNAVEINDLFEAVRRGDWRKKYGLDIFLEGPPAFFTLQEMISSQCGTCPFLNMLGILADGEVSFCGVGYSQERLKLGPIGSISVEKVWRDHPVLAQARAEISRGVKGICGECVFASRCRGSCRALAYQSGGSFDSPHPWCQYLYDRGRFNPAYMRQGEGPQTSQGGHMK